MVCKKLIVAIKIITSDIVFIVNEIILSIFSKYAITLFISVLRLYNTIHFVACVGSEKSKGLCIQSTSITFFTVLIIIV